LENLSYAKQNRNRELWEARFKGFKNHTTESTVLGKRIIMTAEPENIKAILATQFLDFGMWSEEKLADTRLTFV
jgi:hypothetical protein